MALSAMRRLLRQFGRIMRLKMTSTCFEFCCTSYHDDSTSKCNSAADYMGNSIAVSHDVCLNDNPGPNELLFHKTAFCKSW